LFTIRDSSILVYTSRWAKLIQFSNSIPDPLSALGKTALTRFPAASKRKVSSFLADITTLYAASNYKLSTVKIQPLFPYPDRGH
jgi:hypothetical protein